ncbi:LuxR family transcriptional regulator [Kitasatospora sp. NPDC048540]|uniref:LuxR C-terminal-related transcriptional regulator n=1 Tax=unclassified Kitasatospora TaxID=2633591 RepID=UPI0011EA66AB|nr:LuxR family transcriptional regulator [Kitasatospora sp. MBT63]
MVADPNADPGDAVFDEAARRCYLDILAEGGRIPFHRVTADRQAAVEQLVQIGLVVPNPLDCLYTAVSPRTVTERLSTEMRGEATRLLLRAERLPGALDSLARAYDALPGHGALQQPEPGGATYVEGHDAIRHRIAQLVSECRKELLSAQPGFRPASALALALPQDLLLLGRGGELRVIYQPVNLAAHHAIDYAARVTEHGAGVRVLDEPFRRMLIVDRLVAVLPASDDHSRAVFVTDPASICFLAAVFERDWERADIVRWRESDAQRVTRTATDRVGRLLTKGLTQRAVATRLGLSERTVAGHISRLRERYGAQTLFQLGWLMRGGGGRP